jgi:hypothetical protein
MVGAERGARVVGVAGRIVGDGAGWILWLFAAEEASERCLGRGSGVWESGRLGVDGGAIDHGPDVGVECAEA